MVDADFLHGYMTLFNNRKLGFKNYILYLKLKTLNEEKDLMDFLMRMDEVTTLKSCSGNYDVQAIFSVKTEEDFLEVFSKVTNAYHQIIQNYDLLELLEENFLGLSLLLDETERKKLHNSERKGSSFQKELLNISHPSQAPNLDKKDIQIMRELKMDARIGVNELSKKVHLAPNSVKVRIKKMIATGIIKKFIPIASLSVLGYQWWKVFFKFRNLDKAKFQSFLRYHPNILWYMMLLGKWDYQISVFAKDNAEFHKVIDELRSEFADNIISYDSIIIFNQFKYIERTE
jgi:Lrp/AsnC family leucine-responsive transcriptional regulator